MWPEGIGVAWSPPAWQDRRAIRLLKSAPCPWEMAADRGLGRPPAFSRPTVARPRRLLQGRLMPQLMCDSPLNSPTNRCSFPLRRPVGSVVTTGCPAPIAHARGGRSRCRIPRVGLDQPGQRPHDAPRVMGLSRLRLPPSGVVQTSPSPWLRAQGSPRPCAWRGLPRGIPRPGVAGPGRRPAWVRAPGRRFAGPKAQPGGVGVPAGGGTDAAGDAAEGGVVPTRAAGWGGGCFLL